MKCPECGARVPDSADFCKKCGAWVDTARRDAGGEPEKKRPKRKPAAEPAAKPARMADLEGLDMPQRIAVILQERRSEFRSIRAVSDPGADGAVTVKGRFNLCVIRPVDDETANAVWEARKLPVWIALNAAVLAGLLYVAYRLITYCHNIFTFGTVGLGSVVCALLLGHVIRILTRREALKLRDCFDEALPVKIKRQNIYTGWKVALLIFTGFFIAMTGLVAFGGYLNFWEDHGVLTKATDQVYSNEEDGISFRYLSYWTRRDDELGPGDLVLVTEKGTPLDQGYKVSFRVSRADRRLAPLTMEKEKLQAYCEEKLGPIDSLLSCRETRIGLKEAMEVRFYTQKRAGSPKRYVEMYFYDRGDQTYYITAATESYGEDGRKDFDKILSKIMDSYRVSDP